MRRCVGASPDHEPTSRPPAGLSGGMQMEMEKEMG